MNIFVVDRNPVIAARNLCDKHVVKMVLESTQMLSTVARKQRPNTAAKLYKPTHANHPCTRWVGDSPANARWLISHTEEMFSEYSLRYGGKIHASYEVFENAKRIISLGGSIIHPSHWALAMPDQYKDPSGDPVKSYRAFYWADKAAFASWRQSPRGEPGWWQTMNKGQAQP